jgi:hypothetical protein
MGKEYRLHRFVSAGCFRLRAQQLSVAAAVVLIASSAPLSAQTPFTSITGFGHGCI